MSTSYISLLFAGKPTWNKKINGDFAPIALENEKKNNYFFRGNNVQQSQKQENNTIS